MDKRQPDEGRRAAKHQGGGDERREMAEEGKWHEERERPHRDQVDTERTQERWRELRQRPELCAAVGRLFPWEILISILDSLVLQP